MKSDPSKTQIGSTVGWGLGHASAFAGTAADTEAEAAGAPVTNSAAANIAAPAVHFMLRVLLIRYTFLTSRVSRYTRSRPRSRPVLSLGDAEPEQAAAASLRTPVEQLSSKW
ncbi:hypothetical protein GCM10010238_48430 [Streptomyces griseoviridis]|uniref:Uncharacterized protein n=1 Tax=Streptomyces griseoviridis TaxID=45398 RepID=A0A918GQQ6_STRGD|nr:hypothetical protein GCM10010238_48430 [Streptomyces niveoruber]